MKISEICKAFDITREEFLKIEKDEHALKNKYRELARKYHPDFASDEKDKNLRTEKMAAINNAYEAIKTKNIIDDTQSTFANFSSANNTYTARTSRTYYSYYKEDEEDDQEQEDEEEQYETIFEKYKKQREDYRKTNPNFSAPHMHDDAPKYHDGSSRKSKYMNYKFPYGDIKYEGDDGFLHYAYHSIFHKRKQLRCIIDDTVYYSKIYPYAGDKFVKRFGIRKILYYLLYPLLYPFAWIKSTRAEYIEDYHQCMATLNIIIGAVIAIVNRHTLLPLVNSPVLIPLAIFAIFALYHILLIPLQEFSNYFYQTLYKDLYLQNGPVRLRYIYHVIRYEIQYFKDDISLKKRNKKYLREQQAEYAKFRKAEMARMKEEERKEKEEKKRKKAEKRNAKKKNISVA